MDHRFVDDETPRFIGAARQDETVGRRVHLAEPALIDEPQRSEPHAEAQGFGAQLPIERTRSGDGEHGVRAERRDRAHRIDRMLSRFELARKQDDEIPRRGAKSAAGGVPCRGLEMRCGAHGKALVIDGGRRRVDTRRRRAVRREIAARSASDRQKPGIHRQHAVCLQMPDRAAPARGRRLVVGVATIDDRHTADARPADRASHRD